MSQFKYGWKRDLPDPRDHISAPTLEEQLATMPTAFSLRDKMPPVYNQGQLGSCTANSIGSAVQFQQMKQAEAEGQHVPSRLFIYWNERNLEGTVNTDSGAQIRDGIKVVGEFGAPAETDWPYNVDRFAERPPQSAFDNATKFKAVKYGRVTQSTISLQRSIFYHRPVVFGFTVFESFETRIGSDGVMPMPDFNNEQVLGGHAVKAMGWKPINGHIHFEVKNSWGTGWGDNGYFWMPAEYITNPNLASDFWHIDLES